MGTESIVEVRKRALAEDIPGFIEALVVVAEAEGFWGNKLQELKKAVILQRQPWWIPAATALAARIRQVKGDNARTFLEYVVDGLIDGDDRHFDAEQARAVLKIAAGGWVFYPSYRLADLGKIVLKAGGVLDDDVVAVMRRSAAGPHDDRSLKAFVAGIKHPLLNRGEPWADRALADLSTMDSAWSELVALAATATDHEPSARWEKQGRRLLASLGEHHAREVITGWLALLGRPRTLPLSDRQYGIDVEYTADPFNSVALRGLVWLLGFLPADAALVALLGGLVEQNLRKIPGVGPRNAKVAGGAVYALGRLDSDEAISEISRLTTLITHKNTLKQLHAILDERAASRKLSRDEMALVAVPTFGLTEVGLRTEVLGQDTATLRIDNGRVSLDWRNAAGNPVQSAPTAVKVGFPERLKQMKAETSQIAKTLTAQAERLDREFLSRRVWRLSSWRLQYLDHVLLGTLTRRLLWLVGGRPCGFADGCLRELDGTALHAADRAEVSLWHPLGWEPEEVLARREWLHRYGIEQPLEQVDRQIYRPGDAFRFAGQAVNPHKLHARAGALGWERGGESAVTRDLPAWGLRAEFGVDGAAAGQVRFYRLVKQIRYAPKEPPQGVVLEQVPPLVFSEMMRDAELFSR